MTPDPSAFAEPCAITAGAFCLTHRASTTDPRSEECVAMALHDEVDRLRAGIEGMRTSAKHGGAWSVYAQAADLLDPTEGRIDE